MVYFSCNDVCDFCMFWRLGWGYIVVVGCEFVFMFCERVLVKCLGFLGWVLDRLVWVIVFVFVIYISIERSWYV